mgnify:FL=1
MTTEYQLWIFHEHEGWLLRDFCDSVQDAKTQYDRCYPAGGMTYRIVAVQVCR